MEGHIQVGASLTGLDQPRGFPSRSRPIRLPLGPLLALSAAGVLVFAALCLGPGLYPFLEGLTYSGAAAFLGLWAFRARARARPETIPRLEAAALCAASGAGLVLLYQNVLVHDALWYYSYLRSALVDHDLDLFEEFVLRNPHGMYLPPPGTPIFHIGISLLQAPLAWVVRPIARFLSTAGIVPGGDGYGPLEVGVATWSSMMAAIGGVALTHRLARRFSGGPASAVAQVALLYASPLAFFAYVWPGYPHAGTVLLGGIFLLLWISDGTSRAPWRSVLLGCLAGLLAVVHPQDILYIALPGLDLLDEVRSRRFRTATREGLALLTGAAIGFLPQVAAWAPTSGRFLPNVYSEIGDPFQWSHPAFLEVLFSGYNGLFTWSPLCAVAVAGLVLLRREHPRAFRGLLALLVLEWWAIASYGYWWGGASFGARYFLSAYPVLGVGLAVALARLAKRIGLLWAGLATAPFVYWNLLLMAQFRLEWVRHNERPDFSSVLVAQLFYAPEALARGLVGSFRWNQALVPEQILAALESGSMARVLFWALCALGLVVLVVLWVVFLLRRFPVGPSGEAPGPSALRRPAIVLLTCSILAACAVLSVAHGNGRRRLLTLGGGLPLQVRAGAVVTLPLEAPPSGPTPARPTAVSTRGVEPRAPGESLALDLVSFLRFGGSRKKGEIVAWLSPEGAGCGDLSYPLRAGHETAETASDRLEARGGLEHDIQDAKVVQSWWQNDFSAGHYWGRAYLASWELPAACEPSDVVLRTTSGAGSLEVRQLAVSANEPERP